MEPCYSREQQTHLIDLPHSREMDNAMDMIAVGLLDLRHIVFSETDRLTVLNLHGNKLSHLSGMPILHHLVNSIEAYLG